MTEGQAWADLERGSSGDLHTLLPPGLLDSFSNCPYNFFCIQCMRACAHTHTYTQSLELPLQFLLRSAHTHTHLLRAKVRTRLQQQKSHQRVHTHTHTHRESLGLPLQFLLRLACTHTYIHLRTKVGTCLPQQKSHQHNILSCLYFEMRVVFKIIQKVYFEGFFLRTLKSDIPEQDSS